MGTPDFVVSLRAKVGGDLLWLSGVTAVVLRGTDVLLVRRADSGAWTAVTGIIDPGEQPAVAARREVREETRVDAFVQRLVWVHALDPVRYPNGDQAQYLDLVFRCSWQSGDAGVGDEENTEVRWFPLAGLPPMSPDMSERIRLAVEDHGPALFAR